MPNPLQKIAGRKRRFLQAALIVLAGGWVFFPALHGGWIWDDTIEVTRNAELRGGLWRIWLAPAGADYFPLKSTVQWFEWRLWGDHVLGYHLFTVGVHLLDALLVWRLFRQLGLRLAWLGGLLFAVHPLVVESVAWIAELKNTLSLLFLLFSMSAYLDFDDGGQKADYRKSLLLFVAAMLCKSSVVMFPVVILLHAGWKRRRLGKRDLEASAAFFAVSLALGLVTVWFQHHRAIANGEIPLGGFFSRLAAAGLSIGFYFFKCFWPVGLGPIYPRWPVVPPAAVQFLPWIAIVALLGWFWTKRATWGRHVLFGAGFFLINLWPVLGFIAMAYLRVSWVADHFVYLPLIGIIGLIAGGAGVVWSGLADPSRPYVLGATFLALGLLCLQSRRSAGIFRDEEVFWASALERNPQAWLAANNLGNAWIEQGKLPQAAGMFERAVKLDPGYAAAHYNLGGVFLVQNRFPQAVEQYRQAVQISPDDVAAHNNLGRALLGLGQVPEAIAQFEYALQLRPDFDEAHSNLGGALVQAGRPTEAISQYQEALRLKPDFPDAHYNLGGLFFQTNLMPEAIREYQAALRLAPNDADAHYRLGNAFALSGQMEDAIKQYEETLRLSPGDAEVHYNLGTALLKVGRMAEAVAQYQDALRLKPDYARARDGLARLQEYLEVHGP